MAAGAVRRGARTAWVRRRHGGHGSFDGGEMVEENGMLLPRPGKRRKGGEGLDDAATGEGLEVPARHDKHWRRGRPALCIRASSAAQGSSRRGQDARATHCRVGVGLSGKVAHGLAAGRLFWADPK
jgi:hypothetical protein